MSICDDCKNKDICKYNENIEQIEKDINNNIKTPINFIKIEVKCDKKIINYPSSIRTAQLKKCNFLLQYCKFRGVCDNCEKTELDECPYNHHKHYHFE